MFHLETDRLKISKFTIGDAPFILKITNSNGWLTYIGDRNIHSIKDAENYLNNDPIASYGVHGFGLFKVALKNSNKSIGICGFKKRPELNYPDLGFAFLPEFEGKGYAFESSKALITWADKKIDYTKILAITLKENRRSISLLQRLGFHLVDEYKKDEEVLLRLEIELN